VIVIAAAAIETSGASGIPVADWKEQQ